MGGARSIPGSQGGDAPGGRVRVRVRVRVTVTLTVVAGSDNRVQGRAVANGCDGGKANGA